MRHFALPPPPNYSAEQLQRLHDLRIIADLLEAPQQHLPFLNLLHAASTRVIRAQEDSLASDLTTDRFNEAYEENFADVLGSHDEVMREVLLELQVDGVQVDIAIQRARERRISSICPTRTARERASFARTVLGTCQPEEVFFRNMWGSGRHGLAIQQACGYCLPIEGTLRRLLANPHVLRAVANPPPPSGILDDEAAGIITRSSELPRLYPDALRLRVYYDDLELCEVKSSYTRKVGAFYFTLLNLPRQCRSALDSIELLALAYKQDIQANGVGGLLSNFTTFLQQLQRGWRCQLAPGVEWTFFGLLTGTLGDNLGQQYMGAWKEGSAALLCCRHCLLTKLEIQDQVPFSFFFCLCFFPFLSAFVAP
jgi:hypothetical protein